MEVPSSEVQELHDFAYKTPFDHDELGEVDRITQAALNVAEAQKKHAEALKVSKQAQERVQQAKQAAYEADVSVHNAWVSVLESRRSLNEATGTWDVFDQLIPLVRARVPQKPSP